MKHRRQILASVVIGLPLLICSTTTTASSTAQQPTATQQPAAAPQPSTAPQPAIPQAASSADHSDMPEGAGKDLTLRTCSKCHAITNITKQHKDIDGWTAIITKMVGYGLVAPDDDLETILAYLAKNYGLDSPPAPAAGEAHTKIEVNQETAPQLAAHLSLTHAEAQAVRAYRSKY